MDSEEFRKIRIEIGISQKRLGKIMSLSQPNIARLETTRRPTKIQAAFLTFIKSVYDRIK